MHTTSTQKRGATAKEKTGEKEKKGKNQEKSAPPKSVACSIFGGPEKASK